MTLHGRSSCFARNETILCQMAPTGVLHIPTALAECHPRKVFDRTRWFDHPPEYLLDRPFLFHQAADAKWSCLLAELIGKH